eukprot:scaffold232543_cov30-Tisochrysis_lutea.AAC.2
MPAISQGNVNVGIRIQHQQEVEVIIKYYYYYLKIFTFSPHKRLWTYYFLARVHLPPTKPTFIVGGSYFYKWGSIVNRNRGLAPASHTIRSITDAPPCPLLEGAVRLGS